MAKSIILSATSKHADGSGNISPTPSLNPIMRRLGRPQSKALNLIHNPLDPILSPSINLDLDKPPTTPNLPTLQNRETRLLKQIRIPADK